MTECACICNQWTKAEFKFLWRNAYPGDVCWKLLKSQFRFIHWFRHSSGSPKTRLSRPYLSTREIKITFLYFKPSGSSMLNPLRFCAFVPFQCCKWQLSPPGVINFYIFFKGKGNWCVTTEIFQLLQQDQDHCLINCLIFWSALCFRMEVRSVECEMMYGSYNDIMLAYWEHFELIYRPTFIVMIVENPLSSWKWCCN